MKPRRSRPRVWAGLALVPAVLAAIPGCRFDNDVPAPASEDRALVCTTRGVLPKLLAEVDRGAFDPVKGLLVRRFLPTPENPDPDPSVRHLVEALVVLVGSLGLGEVAETASVTKSSDLFRKLKPVLLPGLRYTAGQLDGRVKVEEMEALAFFIESCDADHLLGALEALFQLRSPSHGGRRWYVVALEEGSALLGDPFLGPFLDSFERNSEKGRAAIIPLVAQIMTFLDDDDFTIARVETLMESAVYPAIDGELEGSLRRLVALLGEATDPEVGVFPPLQRAMRCGNQSPEMRNRVVGYLFDVVTSEELGFQDVLETSIDVISDAETELLVDKYTDVIAALRQDREARANLFLLLAAMLKAPDVEPMLGMLIDIYDAEIIEELLEAVIRILNGCGREPS